MKGHELISGSAAAKEPHNRVTERPAASKGGSEVGNETKANVRGVQEGGSRAEARGSVPHTSGPGETKLHHAMHELKSQHPIHHSDHGPHHGRTDHIRHVPLHGMSPGGKYSR